MQRKNNRRLPLGWPSIVTLRIQFHWGWDRHSTLWPGYPGKKYVSSKKKRMASVTSTSTTFKWNWLEKQRVAGYKGELVGQRNWVARDNGPGNMEELISEKWFLPGTQKRVVSNWNSTRNILTIWTSRSSREIREESGSRTSLDLTWVLSDAAGFCSRESTKFK